MEVGGKGNRRGREGIGGGVKQIVRLLALIQEFQILCNFLGQLWPR